jgi:hypothetical protein
VSNTTPRRRLARADNALLLVLDALSGTPWPCACRACQLVAQQVPIRVRWCTPCCTNENWFPPHHSSEYSYQTQCAASGDALLHWCGRETAAQKVHHSKTMLAASSASQAAAHAWCNKAHVVGSHECSSRKYIPLGCTHFRRPVASPIRHMLRAAAAEAYIRHAEISDMRHCAADAGMQACRAGGVMNVHVMGLRGSVVSSSAVHEHRQVPAVAAVAGGW